ncbi:hypothetical protein AgCh_009568 [Apium graveolens]
MLSYRGYALKDRFGASEGFPSQQGIVKDSQAALDHLVQRIDIDKSSIVVFGRSLEVQSEFNCVKTNRTRVNGKTKSQHGRIVAVISQLAQTSPSKSLPTMSMARFWARPLPVEPSIRAACDWAYKGVSEGSVLEALHWKAKMFNTCLRSYTWGPLSWNA